MPVKAQIPPDTVIEVAELEVVVGSRAGVADPATLPVPVDIYGAEEISRLGEVDLAEVLGRIAPSFNSTRLSAGDGAAFHVATLRGMNGDQVLVLVNGKRRHGIAFAKVLTASGQGTTGTDLRAIPVDAIKRIEVLREGAASQYGSDAIAGVINIVLKDDTDGLSASTYLGRTSRGDGLRLLTSANAGIPLGEGFLNVTMEMSRQEVTNRAGAAPTCFGPDPGYGPCANGGKVVQLMRNGEPDYKGAGFMAKLCFEQYSDAGASLTGKVAGRVELGETGAARRGAVSTGFRAPRLPQRGFNTIGFVGGSDGLVSAGFLPEGDPVACQDFCACSLDHETSLSFTGGFVYSHDSGLLVTADYYRIQVGDAIALTQSLTQSHGLRPGAWSQGRPVDAVAQIWSMEYPSESPYGVAGRIWYMRVSVVGG